MRHRTLPRNPIRRSPAPATLSLPLAPLLVLSLAAAAAGAPTPGAPPPPRQPLAIRMNCGGPAYQTQSGTLFIADQPATVAPGGYAGGEARDHHDAPAAAGTADPELYATCRSGGFHYRFAVPVPGESLHVRLHFAEHEAFVIEGVRRFAIEIDGQPVAGDYDVYRDVLRHYATCLSVPATSGGDSLTIAFIAEGEEPTSEPQLCALEIVSAAGGAPPADTPALAITAGYNVLTLDLDVPSNPHVAGFRVLRATAPGGPFSQIGPSPWPATRYHDLSVPAGVTTYYQVRELAHDGAAGPPSAVRAGVALDPAGAPLPTYEITISDSLLAWLDAHPFTDTYVAGGFRAAAANFPQVGLRYRGVVARTYPRKNWKVKLDEYVPGQTFQGKDRLNFNSQWPDPSQLREYTAYALHRRFVPIAVDCFPVHLDLNTQYQGPYSAQFHGVYTWNEQVDQDFFDQYGIADVVLYKVVPSEPAGDLSLRGTYQEYVDSYEKKTYEQEGYDDLIAFIELLNLTPDPLFTSTIAQHFDVDGMLDHHALFVLAGDWDKYWNNYYIYRQHTGDRWAILPFDYDNTFRDMFPLEWAQGEFVLPTRILAQPVFQLLYLRKLRKMFESWWREDGAVAHLDSVAAAIQPEILLDRRRAFDAETFPGAAGEVEDFMRIRRADILPQLDALWPLDPLCVNEVMPHNLWTVQDEQGEYEPWIELRNTGSTPYALGGLWITRDLGQADMDALPDTVLAPGARLLLWADGEPAEGSRHLSFRLEGTAGEAAGIFRPDGPDWQPLDAVFLPALPAGVSYGRYPEDGEQWLQLGVPTPGAANSNAVSPVTGLRLNELMAINDTTIADEAGEYDDWVELVNQSDLAVNLAGLFLSDALAEPQKWAFPAVEIAAHDFLLVWADNDAGQGPLHASFKLSGSGEEVGLFDRIASGNALLDSVSFGAQTADVSYGRLPDATGAWQLLPEATPGAANAGSIGVGEEPAGPGAPPAAPARPVIHRAHPNPFVPRAAAGTGGSAGRGAGSVGGGAATGAAGAAVAIGVDLPAAAALAAEVYDVRGRRIRRLTSGRRRAGRHAILWDGRDARGRRVASGVYLVRVRAGTVQRTARIVVLR